LTTTKTVKPQVAAPIPFDPPQPALRQHLRGAAREGAFMLDIVMLALGLGFFVAAIGYTYACERL
jgi:hypothetical protein